MGRRLSTRGFVILSVAVVAACLLLVTALGRGWFFPERRVVLPDFSAEAVEAVEPQAQPEGPLPPGHVRVGGVVRPISDVQRAARPQRQTRSASPLAGVGRTPSVPLDANPHTESVAEALAGRRDLSYRLSSIHPAPEFDRASYEADPEGYLNEVAPGRVWQVLEAGADVEPISRLGAYYHEVIQGETVVLRAETEPGMPAHFYSPRLGAFDNQLHAISVPADEEGIAEVRFTPGPGTHGELDVLASSPVRSGFARFLVKVVLPRPPVGGDPGGDGDPGGPGEAAGDGQGN